MSSAPDSHTVYDVIIAGGGLVGGSLAVALAQTDLRVALVEAVPHDSAVQPSFDDRTIALSHGSCTILRQLGLWELLADSVFAIERIHVSEQRRFGTALIEAREQGISELGHVIKGRNLGAALWQRIAAMQSLAVACPARVTATARAGDLRHVTVNLNGTPQTLQTRLLVVADGARSALRNSLGIGCREADYGQSAIVANVQVAARYAGATAYERFMPAGPLAMLPGQDGRYTAVLARPTAVAAQLLALDDAGFIKVLQDALGFRLGRLQRVGIRTSYPLSLVTADALTAERAVMIGNAAQALHPVAGQGFNLGLRDAASLAEVLADAGPGSDAGAADLLAAYADWRRGDQRKVVAFTDGLIRGFGMPGSALATLRGLTLTLFDVMPAGKRELARQTMGLAGRMTRLARGLPL